METKVSVRAHAVIFDKQVYRNCIVSYSPEDNTVVPHIIPFSTEVHSTTSYNGIIIFAPLGFTLPPDLDMPHAIAAPGATPHFSTILPKLPLPVDSLHIQSSFFRSETVNHTIFNGLMTLLYRRIR